MESILKCSVCLEVFENPKVLPCQHTFCSHCLVGIAKAREGIIVCPQCRESFLFDPRKGVDYFPANIVINNVLDFINDASLLKKENHCSSCAGVNVASCRCLFCGEFLCQDCGPSHNEQKQLSEGDSQEKGKHQVADLSVLTSASSVKPKVYPVCLKHRDEILKYHCEQCERAVCRDCSVFDHRDHKVILLKDALKELKGTVGEMLEEGREQVPKIEQSIENTGSLIEKLKVQYENTRAEIRATKERHIEELKRILDSREKELLEDLRGCFKLKTALLQTRQKGLEQELGVLMSACEFAENKLKMLAQDYTSSKKEILDSLKGIKAWRNMNPGESSEGRLLWIYSDNKLTPALKTGTCKAMGCLVFSDHPVASEPSNAAAAPGDLDDSFYCSSSQESASSALSSEDGAAGIGHVTVGPQQLYPELSELRNFSEHFIFSRADEPSTSVQCNICKRTNHTDTDCYAKRDVNGRPIDLDAVTCCRCGHSGHLPKNCLNCSTSAESWVTVDDSSEDEPQGCGRCGRTNHVVSDCYARYSIDGRRLSPSGTNWEKDPLLGLGLRCSRCGRKNHDSFSCIARYTIDGRKL